MIKGLDRDTKFYERFGSVIDSKGSLLTFARNYSQKAKDALAEANSFSIETVAVYLKKLPKSLDGFRIVQLSDIHHSPFTSGEFIELIVEKANELNLICLF